MNFLDYLILGVLVFGLISGAIKGFISQVVTIVGIIIGYFAALLFTDHVAPLLMPHLGFASDFAGQLSFLFLFIGGFLVVKIAGIWIEKIGDLSATKGLNMALGALMGFLKYTFFILILDVFLIQINIIPKEAIADSKFYPLVRAQSEYLQTVVDVPNSNDVLKLIK